MSLNTSIQTVTSTAGTAFSLAGVSGGTLFATEVLVKNASESVTVWLGASTPGQGWPLLPGAELRIPVIAGDGRSWSMSGVTDGGSATVYAIGDGGAE